MIRTITIALLLLAPHLSWGAEPVDQNGVAQQWKGASGRLTVIDFAASWCRPCWGVLPKLDAYAHDHPAIRVIVIDVDDAVAGRDALVDKLGLTVPVLWDAEHEIARHYEPSGMPATFVLDPEGNIVYSHVGSSQKEWDRLTAFLDEATRAGRT